MGEVVLRMKNINKDFPGVKALDNVDFTLRKGEIHALMGENGAGKSTLIKVLTGAESFQDGSIFISGKEGNVISRSPQEAQHNGISSVYQEVNLCPNLTVAENIFVGREPKKFGLIDWKKMNKEAEKLMDRLNIKVAVDKTLENYSVAIQQMIAIARAVDISSEILILDEPTSSLDEHEVEKLFILMNQLKSQGVGIVFVTHFLEQVYEICDRITVLRNGGLVGEYEVENLPRVQLVAKMMGKTFDDLAVLKKDNGELCKFENEKPFICAEKLGAIGVIKPFDLNIYKGEVIGLTGLLGSGRTELAELLYGSKKAESGELLLNGSKINPSAPIDTIKKGMAMVPEDRKAEGIIADLSVKENLIIALLAKNSKMKLLSTKEQDELADKYIEMLQIKTASRETPIKQLSGGNQQKVIIGRWLITNPDFLILDEPTRGIDVGTKTEIQKLVLKLAEEGKSVIFISSELDEMIRTTTRMIVLRDGEKVGEIDQNNFSHSEIMAAIAGGGEDD